MKFRIQENKNVNGATFFNPQTKSWLLGRWKSIIYFPNEWSICPFELSTSGKCEYPTKEQAQGVIDAYKGYMENKTFLNL